MKLLIHRADEFVAAPEIKATSSKYSIGPCSKSQKKDSFCTHIYQDSYSNDDILLCNEHDDCKGHSQSSDEHMFESTNRRALRSIDNHLTNNINKLQNNYIPQHNKQIQSQLSHNDVSRFLLQDNYELLYPVINSGTFVRERPPLDLLSNSRFKGPKVGIDMSLNAAVHVGGGFIRGNLQIEIESSKVQLGSIALDCLGVESVGNNKSHILFSVAKEMMEFEDSPLNQLVYTDIGQCPEDGFWPSQKCRTSIPFDLHLPLNVGPGTFECKEGQVKYYIFATLRYKLKDKIFLSRVCKNLLLFTALHPDRALVPSEHPITCIEEGPLFCGGKGSLKVEAKLHRPVWISGQLAFVEVCTTNHSTRTVRKIKLELLRQVIIYNSPPANTKEQTLAHERVPDYIKTKILSSSILYANDPEDTRAWKGVKPDTNDSVICQLLIPSAQLTVNAGRHLAVKYFINISVGTAFTSKVVVQVPILVANLLSLDIVSHNATDVALTMAKYQDLKAPVDNISSRAFKSSCRDAGSVSHGVDCGSSEDSEDILSAVLRRKLKPLDIEKINDEDSSRFVIREASANDNHHYARRSKSLFYPKKKYSNYNGHCEHLKAVSRDSDDVRQALSHEYRAPNMDISTTAFGFSNEPSPISSAKFSQKQLRSKNSRGRSNSDPNSDPTNRRTDRPETVQEE
ncbi:hypothetical protein MERGE_002744 [Pneumocystis wakefieldiae]|uniref:Arrestin C-terminal-like domain-containing protein n=1 Tax=Pneumocystis wakefieldiae TaxID=38082 RepID=A0A899FXU7_9ASCO|nr:hypothetical protein MERGE_002744 [Pneumocystis wakefieldiae]